ncbi:unnamed protein product, partial [Amoebophrya sp. A25]
SIQNEEAQWNTFASTTLSRRYAVPNVFFDELQRLDAFLLGHFSLLLEDVPATMLSSVLYSD